MKLQAAVVILLTSMVVASHSFLFPELSNYQTTGVMNRVLKKSIRQYRSAMNKVSTLTPTVTIFAKPGSSFIA